MSIRGIVELSDCMCDQLSQPDLSHAPDCPQRRILVDVKLAARDE